MKLNRIMFFCSMIVFLLSWGIKANIPVDRPSNIQDEPLDAWYEKEYAHLYNTEEWYLNSSDPSNYVKVEGYESIYQCENTDGTVSYFREQADENGNKTYILIQDFIP